MDPQTPYLGRSRSRHVVPRRSLIALSVLAILGSLSSTALAHRQASHLPQATRPAYLDAAGSSTALEPIPISTQLADIIPSSQSRYLRRRQNRDEDEEDEEDDSRSTSRDEADDRTTSDDESTTRPRTTATSSVTSGAASSSSTPSPLPQPFDDNFLTDFSVDGDSSCPVFMRDLFADAAFQHCYPISMMLRSSNSFFEAQARLTDIVRVLDNTCAPDVDYCAEYLDNAARNLTASENCGQEFEADHSLTMSAYVGLRNYRTLYAATCLVEPEQDMYCYASAVTNSSNVADTYFYFMPYGLQLPGSTVSCSWCTQETMAIFHSASADRSQPVSETYESAALQVNSICGPGTVNDTLPSPESGSSFNAVPSHTALIAGIGILIAINTLL